MNFPILSVAWIHSCISTPTCALFINGYPSNYLKTSRDVRQGDPLSSFLFILVSQNLTIILNHVFNLSMILGFDSQLL